MKNKNKEWGILIIIIIDKWEEIMFYKCIFAASKTLDVFISLVFKANKIVKFKKNYWVIWFTTAEISLAAETVRMKSVSQQPCLLGNIHY